MDTSTLRLFRYFLVLVAATPAVITVIVTRHWPLVGDALLTHYMAFLFDHGFAPYRDIVDMNMPGCMLFDWAVMHTMGPGAVAWRVVDGTLLAAGTAAMMAVAKPCDWVGGLFGGAMLVIVHARDGVDQAGERDLIVAVLLLVGCACALRAWRRDGWMLSLACGLAAGAAVMVKPTAVVWAAGMLPIELAAMRKSGGGRALHHGVAFVVGFLLVMGLTLGFLYQQHVLRDFFGTVTGLMAYHAGIDRLPFAYLISHLIPSWLFPVVLVWLLLAPGSVGWNQWERGAILFSILSGVFSFVAQGKGFPYQRYPAEAFLLLAVGIDCSLALRQGKWRPMVAAAVLLYCLAVIAPVSIAKASHYDRTDELSTSIEADLSSLGGSKLSGQVQCLDTFAGCIGALYDMRLVQDTGFLYDCYLFHRPLTEVGKSLDDRFWSEMTTHPPRVIVVTDQFCYDETAGYQKLNNWPAFSAWLEENYVLYADRPPQGMMHWWAQPRAANGYRVYVRREAGRTAGQG